MKVYLIHILILLLPSKTYQKAEVECKTSSVEVLSSMYQTRGSKLDNNTPKYEPIPEPRTFTFDYIVRVDTIDGEEIPSKRLRKLGHNRYQNDKHDRGNYNGNNQLVGTNYSIAAKTYESFLGRSVTASDMKNMPREHAFEIYEEKFFERKLKGHLMVVHDGIILDIIYNAISSSYGIEHFNEILEDMTGHSSNRHEISPEDVEIFNELCSDINKEAEFFVRYYDRRNVFYTGAAKGKNKRGLLRWLDDYERNHYEKYGIFTKLKEI